MNKVRYKTLSLKFVWFGFLTAITGVVGTAIWVALIALNLPEDKPTMPQNELITLTVVSAVAVMTTLSISAFMLRDSKKTLPRWTKKSAIILVPCVALVLLITTISLSQIDDIVQVDDADTVAPNQDPNVTPLPTPNDLLASTNEERAKNKLNPLSMNAKLSESALLKCNDMITKNYWAHEDSAGTQPWTFITQVGYEYNKAGENLAYGFSNADETTKGWMNSEGHRANILNPDYSEVGFGICRSGNYIGEGEQVIVVQHLAMPAN